MTKGICAQVNGRSNKLKRATLCPLLVLTQPTVQSLAHVGGFATRNWIQALRQLPFASKYIILTGQDISSTYNNKSFKRFFLLIYYLISHLGKLPNKMNLVYF